MVEETKVRRRGGDRGQGRVLIRWTTSDKTNLCRRGEGWTCSGLNDGTSDGMGMLACCAVHRSVDVKSSQGKLARCHACPQVAEDRWLAQPALILLGATRKWRSQFDVHWRSFKRSAQVSAHFSSLSALMRLDKG